LPIRALAKARRAISACIRRLVKVDDTLVMGDSHVTVFEDPIFAWLFPFKIFHICSVGGATASGLENPNSRTQAYPIFAQTLEKFRRGKTIILMLGEVDTGFVVWYRAEKHGLPVDEMLNRAVAAYTRFIDRAAQFGRVIVISAPLPTIKDDCTWGAVANLRNSVNVPQTKRTQAAIQFNRSVQQHCATNGIAYVNLDGISLGADGRVAGWLLNRDSTDHHYDRRAYARILATRLLRLTFIDFVRRGFLLSNRR
jgi:hypothetical protein